MRKHSCASARLPGRRMATILLVAQKVAVSNSVSAAGSTLTRSSPIASRHEANALVRFKVVS
jgi:hypothetical protein